MALLEFVLILKQDSLFERDISISTQKIEIGRPF